jgi:hypothetical protein
MKVFEACMYVNKFVPLVTRRERHSLLNTKPSPLPGRKPAMAVEVKPGMKRGVGAGVL